MRWVNEQHAADSQPSSTDIMSRELVTFVLPALQAHSTTRCRKSCLSAAHVAPHCSQFITMLPCRTSHCVHGGLFRLKATVAHAHIALHLPRCWTCGTCHHSNSSCNLCHGGGLRLQGVEVKGGAHASAAGTMHARHRLVHTHLHDNFFMTTSPVHNEEGATALCLVAHASLSDKPSEHAC